MSQPTERKPMDDLALARLLRELDLPVEPNRRFAERLYAVVRREAARRKPTGLFLLAAAALLATGLAGLAIAGAGLAPRPNGGLLVVGPTPSVTEAPLSRAPTAGTPDPVPSFTASEVMQLGDRVGTGPAAMSAGGDAVWLAQSASEGSQGTVIRIDAEDQSETRESVEPDQTASSIGMRTLDVGLSRVWISIDTVSEDATSSAQWLFSADVDPSSDSRVDPLSTWFGALGIDDADQLWGTDSSGTSPLTDAGEILRTVPHPWGSADEDNWYNSVAPAPAFGSLWAHEASIPALHRLDPVTGEVQATIPLSHCNPGGSGHYGYHPALIYPIYDVDGLPDMIVASCSMDGSTHSYDGSMALIDPATDTVLGVVDTGADFGEGAVLDGRWYVPVRGPERSETGAGNVAVIDATTLLPTPIFASDSGSEPTALVSAGDSLWLVEATRGEDETGGFPQRLVRLQPELDR